MIFPHDKATTPSSLENDEEMAMSVMMMMMEQTQRPLGGVLTLLQPFGSLTNSVLTLFSPSHPSPSSSSSSSSSSGEQMPFFMHFPPIFIPLHHVTRRYATLWNDGFFPSGRASHLLIDFPQNVFYKCVVNMGTVPGPRERS